MLLDYLKHKHYKLCLNSAIFLEDLKTQVPVMYFYAEWDET